MMIGDTILIEEIEYAVLYIAKVENKQYLLLANTTQNEDYLIKRLENDQLVGLESDEFDNIFNIIIKQLKEIANNDSQS